MRFFLIIALLLPMPLWALQAGEALPDPVQEARAVELGTKLRCMVCQAESINDSGAGLAKDLRRAVREQIKAGKTDTEVMSFMQARYGDYVLLKPPVKASTLPLWLTPWLVLIGGLGVLARQFMVNTKARHR